MRTMFITLVHGASINNSALDLPSGIAVLASSKWAMIPAGICSSIFSGTTTRYLDACMRCLMLVRMEKHGIKSCGARGGVWKHGWETVCLFFSET